MFSFHEGGWGMYPTCGAGLFLLGAALHFAWRPEKRHFALLCALTVATATAGATGFVIGVIKSLKAVELPPDERYVAWIGLGESLNNVSLALGLLFLASLAVAVGFWRLALPAIEHTPRL
jgi:hypothetical protein